jgi:hypothetical protein
MKPTTFKTMLLIVFCLFNLNSHSQTKEETIDWLKEKFSKYLVECANEKVSKGSKNLLVSVSPCEITLEYSYRNKYFDKGDNDDNYKYTIPTDNLIFEYDGISTTGERVTFQKMTNNEKKIYKTKIEGFTLFEGETDLKARVKKALDHLATFCPKKKETF